MIAQRHHWLNTFVGILDGAFHLTDEEQFFCTDIINRLLAALRVPERGVPDELPSAVALEARSGLFTVQLTGPLTTRLRRPVRAASPDDQVVSPDAWAAAFTGMLTTAYPDLAPHERVVAQKVFLDVLDALGVPARAAAYFPDDVVRAHHDFDLVP